MANEIIASASLSIFKATIMTSAVGRAQNGVAFTMAGNFTQQGVMSVPTSATAIPLGNVVSPGLAWFANLDLTNYVTLFNGATGAVFARLLPGQFALVPLDPTCVPYAQAHTAACLLEYLLSSQ